MAAAASMTNIHANDQYSINANQNASSSENNELAEQFGYKQQLKRTLSLFSTFGLAFSYISPVVGVYTLFSTGLCTGGPQFIWGVPIVLLGQMAVALVFSELSVVYPISGALYQWAHRLVGPRFGWLVGWLYGVALLTAIASIDLGAAPYIVDFLGLKQHQLLIVLLACGLVVIQTITNLLGVRVTAWITNIGLVVEVTMTVVLGSVILFGPGPHQHPNVIFSHETAFYEGRTEATFSDFLPALLAQAFIFFGFESAACVSEEIVDAKKQVPRSMLLSLAGAGIVTAFLQFALIIGTPDIMKATGDKTIQANIIPYILDAHLGDTIQRILAAFLIVAYVSCAGAVQATAARLLFSYARDNNIPGSSWLAKVSPKTKIPTNATIFSALVPLLLIPTTFIQLGDVQMFTVIINYSVVGIYMSFQAVVFARLISPWLHGMDILKTINAHGDNSLFSLKFLSVPVAVIAQVYGVSMIANIVWPRPANELNGWLTLIISVVVLVIGIILAFVFGSSARYNNKEEHVRPLNEGTPLLH